MADVLIKGRKKPVLCWGCPCVQGGLMGREFFCGADAFVRDVNINDVPPEWCPLVEVPEHGRLIDADELFKRKGDCYDHEGHLLYAVGTGDIMLAPTVTEASEEGK